MKRFKVFSPVDITAANSTSQRYCFIVGEANYSDKIHGDVKLRNNK